MPNQTMQSQTKAYITNCRQKTTTKGNLCDLFLDFVHLPSFLKKHEILEAGCICFQAKKHLTWGAH